MSTMLSPTGLPNDTTMVGRSASEAVGRSDQTAHSDGHSGAGVAGGHPWHRQLRDHRPLRLVRLEVAVQLPGAASRDPLHNTLEWVFARLDAAWFEEGFRG